MTSRALRKKLRRTDEVEVGTEDEDVEVGTEEEEIEEVTLVLFEKRTKVSEGREKGSRANDALTKSLRSWSRKRSWLRFCRHQREQRKGKERERRELTQTKT